MAEFQGRMAKKFPPARNYPDGVPVCHQARAFSSSFHIVSIQLDSAAPLQGGLFFCPSALCRTIARLFPYFTSQSQRPPLVTSSCRTPIPY